MADYRAIAWDQTLREDVEVADTDTLNVGNVAPLSGRLTLGGSVGTPDVYIENGHDFQVWGIGAEFRVDGGADALIQGSGSFQVPAVGTHRIYGGTLSLEIPTSLSDTLTLANGQTVTTSNNGDITLDPHGTGTVNIDANFYATGFDLGDPANRAGTLYADTINANSIVGPINTDGTNANIWAVNQDAVPAVAENVGVMWEATDGLTTLHNWRQLTTTGGREFHLQYKQNPTDPKDLTEAGYTDVWSCDGVANVTTVQGLLEAATGIDVLSGNVTLPSTTLTGGIIVVGGNPFLHNYGSNTYLGIDSGEFTTASTNMVGVGRETFSSLTGIASRSVAVGDYALANTTASSFNVAVGYNALNANLTGDRNTALGEAAASTQTTANDVVAVGYRALRVNQVPGNVAVGSEALIACTTGDSNVAVGTRAAYSSDVGRNNVAIGYEALYSITGGHDNVVLGYHALYTGTNARDCIAIGTSTLELNPTGTGNIAIGRGALGTNAGGTNNTAVGYYAGGSGATGSNNVFLGNEAGRNEAGNNKLYIANSNTATPLIYGDFNSSELTVNADVLQTSAEPFVINYDANSATGEIAGHVVAAGDGIGNVEAWRTRLLGPTSTLWFEHKTNPTDLTDLSEAGYTQFIGLNPAASSIVFSASLVDLQTNVTTLDVPAGTGFSLGGVPLTTALWTATGVDTVFGGPASNADAYHTHSSGAVGPGTNSDVWVVNQDIVAGVAEASGSVWPGSDGSDVLAWRHRTDTNGILHAEYKANPTDLTDLTEAGWTSWVEYDNDAAELRCELDLTFPNGGSIVTTNNGDLALTTNGTGDLLVTADNWNLIANGNVTTSGTEYDFTTNGIVEAQAGRLVLRASTFVQGDAPLVDMRTSVGALDVPAGIAFQIGGVALTTALWTATGVDTVFGGPASNADAYHTHSPGAIGSGTDANVWAVNQDAAAITAEDSAFVAEAGDGTNLQNWQILNDSSSKELVVQYKQDPTDPKDLAEAGYTILMRLDGAAPQVQFPEEVLTENGLVVTNVGITMTGLDIGSVGNRAGTGYFDTLDTTTLIANGTDSNVWQVNEDVAGAVAEQAGTVWLAADGVDVLGWRHRSDTSGILYLEHKTNPVDPSDLSEAWTSFVEYDPTTNELRSIGNLSFPNGGAISTTNNGSLTVNVNGTGNFAVNSNNWDLALLGNVTTSGTAYNFNTSGTVRAIAGSLTLRASASVIADAPTVDLNTSVSKLDVPAGNNFWVGGAQVTTALWTAVGVNTVFGGPASNADAYHTHAGAGVGSGTNSDVWVVNQDIAAGVAEASGSVWPGSDGSDVLAWRHRTDTSGILHVEYKTNPTDLTDLTEAGWTSWVEYDDATSQLRCELDLYFPNGGVLATTNNGDLEINVNGTGAFRVTSGTWNLNPAGNVTTIGTEYKFSGLGKVEAQGGNLTLDANTNNVIAEATTVDLRTNVTNLDVPSGTGFQIGGVALTTANWTAPNVDTLLDGSNADALHTHDEVNGVTIYPPAAANPAGPNNDGDMYFNTTTESWQYYDASRDKWLSTTEFVINLGEDSANGAMLSGYGVSNAATGTGVLIPRDALVKRITARAQGGNATKAFDLLVNGASALSFALVASSYKNNAVDINLTEDDYVWVEASATGTAATDVAVVLWVAWRT